MHLNPVVTFDLNFVKLLYFHCRGLCKSQLLAKWENCVLLVVPLLITIRRMDQTWVYNTHQQFPLMSQMIDAIKQNPHSPTNPYWKLPSVTKTLLSEVSPVMWIMILHILIPNPQRPNFEAITQAPTQNVPGAYSVLSCQIIKTSTHLQSAGGVSAVELTPRI